MKISNNNREAIKKNLRYFLWGRMGKNIPIIIPKEYVHSLYKNGLISHKLLSFSFSHTSLINQLGKVKNNKIISPDNDFLYTIVFMYCLRIMPIPNAQYMVHIPHLEDNRLLPLMVSPRAKRANSWEIWGLVMNAAINDKNDMICSCILMEKSLKLKTKGKKIR